MILERFRATAEQHPDALAIVDGDERITYARLLDEVGRVRAWLRQGVDPRPHDVVAISMSNRCQYAAIFLALCDSGAVLMPCNPQLRPAELRALSAKVNMRGVIADRASRAVWEQTGAVPARAILCIDDAQFPKQPAPREIPQRVVDTAALYMATSGSTGVPRVVPLSQLNLIGSVVNASGAMAMGRGDRIISVVPFHHLHGFNNCMLMPLLSGATVIMMQRFVPEEYARLAAREQATVIIASPFIFSQLAERVTSPADLASVRLCISSGARLQARLVERWKERFGSTIVSWYGTTETSGISMAHARRQPCSGLGGEFVGMPLPNVRVRCVDADGNDTGTGRPGEILACSPATMSGYLGEPQITRQVLVDGFFRTGDLGYMDSDGGLYLTGRIGRMINVGGIKVDPVEVERAIEAIAGVATVYVDCVPGTRAGEMIRARIVVRAGVELTRADIIRNCRLRLGEYKLPRIIEFVESIPVTLAGKTPRALASGTGGAQ
ncbi:MAG TPA: class I adenylate-forming enzyme family protein [Bryobacteraceae bacterium]